ncbi:hypothetical protein STEG23_035560, partial [Scotinomys teguina]
MAGTFQEKSLFIFSDTDRALLTQAPEDTRTHHLIISSRKLGCGDGVSANEYISFYGDEHVLKLIVVVVDVKIGQFYAFNREDEQRHVRLSIWKMGEKDEGEDPSRTRPRFPPWRTRDQISPKKIAKLSGINAMMRCLQLDTVNSVEERSRPEARSERTLPQQALESI